MLLAAHNLSEYINHHLSDHPWPGCRVDLWGMKVTWMSDAIATLLLAACLLLIVVPMLARRRGDHPRGGYNALELLVAFVRDWIARPALHDRAYSYLPFLLTLFFFILVSNLIGLLPTQSLSVLVDHWVGAPNCTVGASPTMVLTVCGGLASLTFSTILLRGFWRATTDWSRKHRWPLALCVPLAPILWFLSLCPPLGGVIGVLLAVPLAALELVGTLAKCFALMVRLFVNLMAGHGLLAVLMMFVFQASADTLSAGLGPAIGIGAICVISSVLVCLLEILVAVLHAYIFTYLSAIFFGLYAEGHHSG